MKLCVLLPYFTAQDSESGYLRNDSDLNLNAVGGVILLNECAASSADYYDNTLTDDVHLMLVLSEVPFRFSSPRYMFHYVIDSRTTTLSGWGLLLHNAAQKCVKEKSQRLR